ncbi:hypothetical protein Cgig2_025448 [Carnegiea gigantea]|uniref:Uncharacterized protein n=1 Tax=Carnegiea gigantea TaxID=171969 RepID=A0A9Q1JNH8_9CARY|nr:hypothetical protein Cgig2_025448 [Carnegiea gigantea]
MKLVGGRWVIGGNRRQLGEWHQWSWKGQRALEERGCDPQMTGFPINEGPTDRLPPPPLTMGRRPWSRPHDPQSVAASGPALPLLFVIALSIHRHLLRSGVSGLEDRQSCPCLLCIKQKEVRSAPNNQKADRGEKEIVGEELQFGELIQRPSVTGLAPPPLELA